MNGLMVAFAFVLPYHVMRTAAAAGMRVHVLGGGPSRALRASRYCASYRTLPAGMEEGEDDLLAELGRVVERRRIDAIFPSDDVSTRLLCGLRGRLPAPTSPLPDLATFDLLNDKGNFTRYCRDRGVRVPEGWQFDTAVELRAALADGAISLPLTIKPTNRSGGVGVFHVRNDSELGLIDRVDYRPVLAQRHIVGETVGLSVVCRNGAILVHAAQRRDDRRFQLIVNTDLLANVERLVAAVGLDGPANFDAVVEDGTGLGYIVECNPRFWYTIYLSMIAGLNFMAPALPGVAVPPARPVGDPFELSVGRTIWHPHRTTRLDWRLVRYWLADPVAYLIDRAKLIDDSGIAVRAEAMAAYAAPDAAPSSPERELSISAP